VVNFKPNAIKNYHLTILPTMKLRKKKVLSRWPQINRSKFSGTGQLVLETTVYQDYDGCKILLYNNGKILMVYYNGNLSRV
jgi:hypothetical protein